MILAGRRYRIEDIGVLSDGDALFAIYVAVAQGCSDMTARPVWLTTAELAERWRATTRSLERWRAESTDRDGITSVAKSCTS